MKEEIKKKEEMKDWNEKRTKEWNEKRTKKRKKEWMN